MSTIEFTGDDLERLILHWRPTVAAIQRAVADYFDVSQASLLARTRSKTITHARHVAMFVTRDRLKLSYPDLGRAFGNRDHTTAMAAVRKITRLEGESPDMRADLAAIDRRLALNPKPQDGWHSKTSNSNAAHGITGVRSTRPSPNESVDALAKTIPWPEDLRKRGAR